MLRRRLTALVATLALIGAGTLSVLPASADTPTRQLTYSGDCAQRPSGTVCAEFSDGYVWLIPDSISDYANNHGTIQIAYGQTANYAHALGTDLIWVLSK